MEKPSKKKSKFTHLTATNVQVVVTVSSITQFDLPTLTLFKSMKTLEPQVISMHKFSFEVSKDDFTKRVMFRVAFNVNMTDENLQILINICKINFEFPQDTSKNFSYNPFEGKTVEQLSNLPHHHSPSYIDIN